MVPLSFLQSESESYRNATDFDFDDITMKTKLAVRAGFIAIKLDETSFFSTIQGFNHGWDLKHHNEYFSQKVVNLSTTNKAHLKYDVFDGSKVNGLRQPIFFIYVLDKSSGLKVFVSLKQYTIKN